MKIHDTILGLLLAALGATVLALAWTYPKMPGQDVGPGMFPGAVAALLIVFGLAIFWRGRRGADRRLFAAGDWIVSPRHIFTGLAIVLGCAAYALLSDRIGFLLIAPPLLFVWHLAFGVRPVPALASALIASLGFWALFYKGLGVPLPWGLLKHYAF